MAHGGFGRRDVAPFSDVDLMILHAPGTEQLVALLASRLLRDLSDVRLELGQSLCTPQQALRLASQDATVCTTLMESRLLAGGEKAVQVVLAIGSPRHTQRGQEHLSGHRRGPA